MAYLSRKCSEKESTYSSRRGEAVALWWAIKTWRPFLEGREFTVVSDHLSLKQLRSKSDDIKMQRIINELEHFSFVIQHKSGREHTDADALSRCHECEAAELADRKSEVVNGDQTLLDTDDHLFDHILSVEDVGLPMSIKGIVLEQQKDATIQSLKRRFLSNIGRNDEKEASNGEAEVQRQLKSQSFIDHNGCFKIFEPESGRSRIL